MKTHIYPTSISPPEFARCDAPVGKIWHLHNNVLIACTDGHLIRGRIIPESEAKQYAERLAKKLCVPVEDWNLHD
jgi:CBS domain containing-hemolysin-like protein